MKLGSQTNSLTNHILSRATIGQPEPKVHMGATVLAWTDRFAVTIIAISEYRGRPFVTVQEDDSIRTDKNGMSESQTYEYHRLPYGTTYHFSQTKDGSWREVMYNEGTGNWNFADGHGLRIGERCTYHDFSF